MDEIVRETQSYCDFSSVMGIDSMLLAMFWVCSKSNFGSMIDWGAALKTTVTKILDQGQDLLAGALIGISMA
ncbi:receptor-like protein kinase HSL1-like protein [Corchorus olitorius]|uniref:Receptor-like protein kinase HSL1-like protein n=1 Tax=Corchorus olitorius TaxID=93759 RepID=A0A1R3J0U6_9ROSI|nr:receptor-like protein kinase HSL1-like protein [Corchorus olitorius]